MCGSKCMCGIYHESLLQIAKLLENDQLKKLMDAGSIYTSFVEAPIKFMPSYKFELNVHPRVYSKEKFRTPSYCDRVLWRKKPNVELQNENYTASTMLTIRYRYDELFAQFL